MALHDILPDLNLLRDSLRNMDERLASASEPYDLDYSRELQRLANEVEDQIRTAERKFTIALVGEFKVGKSTLLNALLGLTGEAALSAQDTPDTACSILLRQRQPGDPEARLVFLDGKTSDVTWAQAKRLTSQVYLDQHPQDRERTRQLLEVEYFLDSPFLAQAQLNDLPGTGSRYWREHTQLTHQKMKEADAVLWVVADREPSAEARRDLGILAQYSHTVVPIVNVIEDPQAVPPLPRNPERDREIADGLLREFRTYFSPEIERPLLLAARVVQLERAKARPSPEVLRDGGLEDLMNLLERMFLAHQEGRTQGRRYRLCGAAAAVIDKAQASLTGMVETLERKGELAEVRHGDAERRVAEIDILEEDLRGSILTLAQASATTICDKIARVAGVFVEDQLQLTQFNNLRRSLTSGSREKLSQDLQERFMGPRYLKLQPAPSWLDDLNAGYAEQVRTVVVAQWARLGRVRSSSAAQLPGALTLPMSDIQRLGKDLQHTVVGILGRMVGVGGFTGVLALLPGGQLAVAAGFATAAAIAVSTNAVAERRRRAVDLIQSQIQAHRHTMAQELFKAGLEGSRQLGDSVRTALAASLDEAARRKLEIGQLRARLREGHEGLDLLRRGLSDLQASRKVA